MQTREILMLTTFAVLLLIPLSALASQLWGHHKRLKSSRVWWTMITILLCPTICAILFFTYSNLRAWEIISLLVTSILLNIFAIWIQRDSPMQNKLRKWVNIGLVITVLGCFSFVALEQLNENITSEPIEQVNGWTDELSDCKSQEEKNWFFKSQDFENDFGFIIPSFDVISKKRWIGNGTCSEVIEIITHEPVSNQFLSEQANSVDRTFRNGVYTFSDIEPRNGNSVVYKITHKDNYSLTITIDYPW